MESPVIQKILNFCAIPIATALSWIVLSMAWAIVIASFSKENGSGDVVFPLMVAGFGALFVSVVVAIVVGIYAPHFGLWPKFVYTALVNFVLSIVVVVWLFKS